MLNQRSPRAIVAQFVKQLICIGMVVIVVTPILLKLFMKSPGEGTPPSIRHDFI